MSDEATRQQDLEIIASLRKRLRFLEEARHEVPRLRLHPNCLDGWRVRGEGGTVRVTACDAKGAEFGFAVMAGWPELCDDFAYALCTVLQAIDKTPGD